MGFWTILIIALGLSMDAFAVSVTNGLALERPKTSDGLRIAVFFGGFQAGMPVAGWVAGMGFQEILSGFAHWIAFALLSFIGIKMVLESAKEEEQRKAFAHLDNIVLLGLAVATSIDALAVGLSCACLNVEIWIPALVIGAVTFIVSFIGFLIGRRFGAMFGRKAEAMGGVILIGIGIKILLEALL